MQDEEQLPEQADGTPILPLLMWQAAALLALVTFALLILGSLWLLFQDYSYPEGVALRVFIIAVWVSTAAVIWKRRRQA